MNENNNMVQFTPAASPAGAEAPRTLEVVAAEIRTYMAIHLGSAVEIGRRLYEAKAMLPYGQFGKWIEENTGFSRSHANNYMRLFDKYAAAQGSLFGAAVENVQAFGHLSVSKALALLALPDGEREEFVETHDVEGMSTRELQAAIEERDEALKRAKIAEERAKAFEDDNTAMEAATLDLVNERDVLKEKVKELEARPVDVQQDQEAIDKAVAEAVEKANAAHAAELNKLKASEEKKRKKLEKQIAEAEKTAKDAEEKADASGKEADSEAEALRAEAEKQKAEADRLRRELAMSGEAIVTFKLFFASWQKDYANMMDALTKADEDTAGRLRAAINAQIEGWSNG